MLDVENYEHLKSYIKSIDCFIEEKIMNSVKNDSCKSTKYIGSEKIDTDKKEIPELYESKERCCGCSACYSICPKSAIEMKLDKEGFLYPVIDDEKCIRCYKCISVCAFKDDQEGKKHLGYRDNYLVNTEVYAARIKDRDILKKSSSGGIFTAISDLFLKNGDAVISSVYDYEKKAVRFQLIISIRKRNEARGSKYMQSDVGDIYRESVLWLEKHPDKKILFVGMGCQTAGFQRFMARKKLSDRIYTVDIICHGTSSPVLWKQYIEFVENKYSGKVDNLQFKDKRNGWKWPTAVASINGDEVFLNEYVKIFYNRCALRPSCYKCAYSKTKRYVDMTIGDYWHIDEKMPDFYDPMGNSLILIHTKRGRELFEKIKENIDYKKSDIIECWQKNLEKPTEMSKYREGFWQEYYDYGIDYIIKKYGAISLKSRIKQKIKRMIDKF